MGRAAKQGHRPRQSGLIGHRRCVDMPGAYDSHCPIMAPVNEASVGAGQPFSAAPRGRAGPAGRELHAAAARRSNYRVKRDTPRADDSTSVSPDTVTVLSPLNSEV